MYHYKVIKDGTLRKVLVVLPGYSKDDLKFFLRRRAHNSYLVCECRKNETVKEIYGDLLSEIEILELNLGFMDNPEVDSYKFENGILEVRIYDQPKKYDFNITDEAMDDDQDYEYAGYELEPDWDEFEDLDDCPDLEYQNDNEYQDDQDSEYPFIRP